MFRIGRHFFWGIVLCGIANAEPAEIPTQVKLFNPPLPVGGKVVEGSCWTSSIAVGRSGAWRCTVGNEIHDPCFTTSGSQDELVCGADPISGKAGFRLKLTQPLPGKGNTATAGSPWVVLLEKGERCEPYTGTMPMTDQGAVSFFCDNPSEEKSPEKKCQTGLLSGSFKEGKIWTVNQVNFCVDPQSKTGVSVEKVKRVSIKTVWE